jgi:hypothetical protein
MQILSDDSGDAHPSNDVPPTTKLERPTSSKMQHSGIDNTTFDEDQLQIDSESIWNAPIPQIVDHHEDSKINAEGSTSPVATIMA